MIRSLLDHFPVKISFIINYGISRYALYISRWEILIWIVRIGNVLNGGGMLLMNWVRLSIRWIRMRICSHVKLSLNLWTGNVRIVRFSHRFLPVTGIRSCRCRCLPVSDIMVFGHIIWGLETKIRLKLSILMWRNIFMYGNLTKKD